jgi:DNA replication and repair protein RecF
VRLLWAELKDFRNHERTRLDDLPEGLITVVGPNGEGKTNLLEGLAFLFFLVSPRLSSTMPLVRSGSSAAYARGEIETRDGRVLVEVEIPGHGANRVQVNRSPVRRKRDLRRRVRAVFFGPEDLDVVRGDPSHRRRFMDEAVTSLWPAKESEITAYERALRQRNRLLKQWEGRGAPEDLEAWDTELTSSGVELTTLRDRVTSLLSAPSSEEYDGVTGYGLGCTYLANVVPAGAEDLEGAFRRRLAERRSDELVRRTTLVGPHRDDLDLSVRDLGARSFASHGEAWAAALCLRLGLAHALADEVGERPVLLLDDPFSALDPRRRDRGAGRLAPQGQVFVSVADAADVPAASTALLEVSAGSVTMATAPA